MEQFIDTQDIFKHNIVIINQLVETTRFDFMNRRPVRSIVGKSKKATLKEPG